MIETINEIIAPNNFICVLIAISIVLIAFFLRGIVSRIIIRILFKIFKNIDQGVGIESFQKLLLKPINWLFLLSVLLIAGSYFTSLDSWMEQVFQNDGSPLKEGGQEVFKIREGLEGYFGVFSKGLKFLFISVVFWGLIRMVDYLGLIFKKRAEKTESKMDDQIIPLAVDSLKVFVIISAVFVLVGSVFEKDLMGLAAGLGIGGVAIGISRGNRFTVGGDKIKISGNRIL